MKLHKNISSLFLAQLSGLIQVHGDQNGRSSQRQAADMNLNRKLMDLFIGITVMASAIFVLGVGTSMHEFHAHL